CSDDTEADGESEPAEQRPVSSSHDTLAPLSEFPLAPVVAPPGIRRRPAILRVRPIPARRLSSRRVSHHSSDHYSSPDSSSSSAPSDHSLSRHTPPDTTDVDSSTPQRFVHRSLARTLRHSEAFRRKGKGKGKGKDKSYIPEPKNPKPSAKERPAKDDACHHCKEVGNWKRNCPIDLAGLILKKKQVGTASSSGLRGARKLKQGAPYLYVGNGVRAQVKAIGSYDLVLPNVLVICLDNCHYAPTITRGVISVSRLVDNGFTQCFMDYGISVSNNDVLYFNIISSNGIYDIDMINRMPNVNSIYVVSNKRAKYNLDSTYLRHCHLAHISKKCIKKMQHDRLSKSTNEESFDKCVSCLSGKMTRKPFPRRTKRATDLLGIIHTDVCGLLRHVSRQEVEEHRLGDLNEPTNYKVVILDMESDKWVDAMNVEMKSMKDNQVWRLVDLPPNSKGFTQTYGVDYEETFSPVADIRAIRILIAIAAFYDYEIWQMDVKTAFLNGYLDEDIYMVQPEGFVDPNHPRKFTKCKDISWKVFCHERFGEAAFILGIKIYRDRSKRLIRLSQSAYMDKILKRHRMDNSKRGYIPMQEKLDLNKTQGASTPEKVKRMQNVPYASAVGSFMYAVRYTRPDVAFAQNIISRFQQNPVELHWTAVKRYTCISNILSDLDGIVDTIIPLAKKRSDIYMVQPKGFIDPDHPRKVGKLQRSIYGLKQASKSWNKRFDEEIKRSTDMFLVYGGNIEAELRVDCYCDAGFKIDKDDTKSQTGYVFVLNGGAVDWKSPKQSNTTMSATEAEYIAASEAGIEAVWIRKFILRLVGPPNSHDIHKMNIGLPQLTRSSLYGSASLGESFLVILNKVANKGYFRINYEACDMALVVFVPSIVEV
ncbi:retrotransposon protein, putative, ty1-copia subclass, partial [Tanacetum coccineum]